MQQDKKEFSWIPFIVQVDIGSVSFLNLVIQPVWMNSIYPCENSQSYKKLLFDGHYSISDTIHCTWTTKNAHTLYSIKGQAIISLNKSYVNFSSETLRLISAEKFLPRAIKKCKKETDFYFSLLVCVLGHFILAQTFFSLFRLIYLPQVREHFWMLSSWMSFIVLSDLKILHKAG